MAPPEKKQKVEDVVEAEAAEAPASEAEERKGEEPKGEEPKAAEPPKELEEDAPASTKPKNKDAAKFLVQDTTMNILPSSNNSILMTLSEGGIHHLVAGARANIGVSKGRYMFEVKIIEHVAGHHEGKGSGKHGKSLLKIGFSTSASDLFIGDSAESIGFEGSGALLHDRSFSKVAGQALGGAGSVVAVVLNLEAGHPNCNTISLFRDGRRLCQPQKVPECLQGKPLFPAVNFKGMSVHVNFGPAPLAKMPFKCTMIQDAARADVTVRKEDVPADGKYEVIFPVGLPDEGTFDRLDVFKSKHPQYVELSERSILAWAEKSALSRHGGYRLGVRQNNDRPEKAFNVRELDDDSIRRALYAIAPLQQRHYIVMEVKSNLLEDERKSQLEPFSDFKKVADVVIGTPSSEYKKRVQQQLLREKQEKSDKAFELAKQEKLRKKMALKKQKEMEKAKKKALKEQQKKVALAKKAREEAAKEKAAAAEGKDEEKKEEEETKEEEKEEESEEEEEEEEPEEPEEKAPKAELDADEKKLLFRPADVKDLAPVVLSANFAKFSVPSKSEGFDEIRYEWSKGADAERYVKQWIMDKKLNSRVEELKPSAWFYTSNNQWQKAMQVYKGKLQEFKNSQSRKAQERMSKKAAREAKKKSMELAATKLANMKPEDDKRTDEQKEAEEKARTEEAAKIAEEESADAEEVAALEKAENEFKAVDIFTCDDIMDVSGGLPLFRDFGHEDWALMNLVFELNLIVHAFSHDVADPDRPGVHVNHLSFYYQRYFNKDLRTKDFGVDSLNDLINIVGDKIVYLSSKEVLSSQLDGEFESFDVFVKLIELARRHRHLQIDLGKEEAKLKISQNAGLGGSKEWHKSPGGKDWGKGGGLGKDWAFGMFAGAKGGKSRAGPYGKGGGKGRAR